MCAISMQRRHHMTETRVGSYPINGPRWYIAYQWERLIRNVYIAYQWSRLIRYVYIAYQSLPLVRNASFWYFSLTGTQRSITYQWERLVRNTHCVSVKLTLPDSLIRHETFLHHDSHWYAMRIAYQSTPLVRNAYIAYQWRWLVHNAHCVPVWVMVSKYFISYQWIWKSQLHWYAMCIA